MSSGGPSATTRPSPIRTSRSQNSAARFIHAPACHLLAGQQHALELGQMALIGLDWAVPDFSTLSRRQKTLKVNIHYRGSDGPLHLLIDSTGIKVEGEGEWNARKHGATKRRIWRKIHIGIDEKSLEIRAAEFTTSDIGDAPMLPELLDQIPPEQEIGSVTADGAFDTRKCHDAIAARGADAIIPPRKNARPWKPDTAGAVARNEILRTSKRVGRTIWRRWSGYHRRSRAEM